MCVGAAINGQSGGDKFPHMPKRRARESNPQPVSRHLISNEAASHSLTLQTAAPVGLLAGNIIIFW